MSLAPGEPGKDADNRVELRDVVVQHESAWGTVQALDCAWLDVEPGTSLAVTGPSGCGKSTLLGLLAGLGVPTAGAVRIGAVTVSSLTEPDRVSFRRSRVGMVYQADNLLPHLTVEENVGLQLAICRGDATAGERSDPAVVLERLGLGSLSGRFPDQLSGGQRQRVAVARAVIHGPAVILADEPTGALDELSARTVVDLLVEAQRAVGATMVLVTHDTEIAGRMDRVVGLAAPVREPERTHAG